MRATAQRRRGERGQAAVEWVLTFPIVVLLIAVLYQALMFERDVFNKMSLARYKALKTAHEEQAEIRKYTVFPVRTQGATIGELTPFEIPAQTIDRNRRYGPKVYYFPCGTKRYFPGDDWSPWTGEEVLNGVETAAVVLDHYETTAKVIQQGADAVGQAGQLMEQVPCEKASASIGKLGDFMSGLISVKGAIDQALGWLKEFGL